MENNRRKEPSFRISNIYSIDTVFDAMARVKKPSGKKSERKRNMPKKPNQIRHDQNAAIATGTWRNKKRAK